MSKKYPAEFIGKSYDKNGYAVHLFYRYRGHEYMITDERNGYSETLATKHRNEQRRIDEALDWKSNSTEDAQKGFDLFFDMLEQEEAK